MYGRMIRRSVCGCTFAVTLALLAVTDGSAAVQADRTIVILVRHAEKEDEPAADPGLTGDGQARAQDLARRLGDAGVDAVYASQYRRTILTGEPLARQLGQRVRIAPIEGETAGYAAALVRRILDEHTGETVVIVNHSNTVPIIARAVGAPDPGPIEDSEYGNLFIVVIGPGTVRELIRAHY